MTGDPAGPDAIIEAYAQAYDALLIPGCGDVLRDAWRDLKRWILPPLCDCPMDPHHRWDCALRPIWAQTMRDLNPLMVITGPVEPAECTCAMTESSMRSCAIHGTNCEEI